MAQKAQETLDAKGGGLQRGGGVPALWFAFSVMTSGLDVVPDRIRDFAFGIPKAELHVHVEGCLEPEQYLQLVARNGMTPKYPSVEAVHERLLHPRDLNTFIEVFEELLSALRTEADFHEVALAYCRTAAAQGVVYAEMSFDPQQHVTRGVALETVLAGLLRARDDAAAALDLRLQFIACFNRDRSLASAADLLERLAVWKGPIVGVGLDNPEEPDFPAKFAPLFARAWELGFRLTTHCDVNVPDTVRHHRDALRLLRVERIDHGLNILDDSDLLAVVRERGIGVTACPTVLHCNRDWRGRMRDRAGKVRALLEAGVRVCANSDDPGLMRGLYVGDLLALAAFAGELTREQVVELARNSFRVAWVSEADAAGYLACIDAFARTHPNAFDEEAGARSE